MMITIDSSVLAAQQNANRSLSEEIAVLRDQAWRQELMLRTATSFTLTHNVTATRYLTGGGYTWIIEQGDRFIASLPNATSQDAFNAAFDAALMIEVNIPSVGEGGALRLEDDRA